MGISISVQRSTRKIHVAEESIKIYNVRTKYVRTFTVRSDWHMPSRLPLTIGVNLEHFTCQLFIYHYIESRNNNQCAAQEARECMVSIEWKMGIQFNDSA